MNDIEKILHNMYVPLMQIMSQIGQLILWDYAERRAPKDVPKNIKIDIYDAIAKKGKSSDSIFGCIKDILNNNKVHYVELDEKPDLKMIKSHLAHTALISHTIFPIIGPWILDYMTKHLKEKATVAVAHPYYSHYYIIFDTTLHDPLKDQPTWVHELTHLYQFRTLGFGSMTWRLGDQFRYKHDNRPLEQEANQVADALF